MKEILLLKKIGKGSRKPCLMTNDKQSILLSENWAGGIFIHFSKTGNIQPKLNRNVQYHPYCMSRNQETPAFPTYFFQIEPSGWGQSPWSVIIRDNTIVTIILTTQKRPGFNKPIIYQQPSCLSGVLKVNIQDYLTYHIIQIFVYV